MEEFVAVLQESIEENWFVKITLSKSAPKSADLRNIYIRRIDLKGRVHLSFTYRYNSKDIVKNYILSEAIEKLYQHLGKDFLTGTLLTIEQDVVIQFNKKRKSRIQYRKPSVRKVPDSNHNKIRNYLIEEDCDFLEKLGIASEGRVNKAHQDKYRQINKFVEIMDSLLLQSRLSDTIKIVDMGCGKGYLTFALYEYLFNQKKQQPEITGIELREHLSHFCNKAARNLGWDKLNFLSQDIADYNNKIDVLIALHACDTATDIAIAKGILAKAELIVTAPCCHKQIRRAMKGQKFLNSILKNGILEERQAEIITDGIRAMILEAHGYQTKVFEFVSLEHTAKNLMITAVRKEDAPEKPLDDILEQVDKIKMQFGIDQHYLEKLLF